MVRTQLCAELREGPSGGGKDDRVRTLKGGELG